MLLTPSNLTRNDCIYISSASVLKKLFVYFSYPWYTYIIFPNWMAIIGLSETVHGDVMTWNNCDCSMWWRHHGKSQIDPLSLVMHLSQAITNAALSSPRTQNDIQSKSCQNLDLYNNENALYIVNCCVAVLSVRHPGQPLAHYNDVIMSAMESQITSLTIVHSSVYSDADQRKHQSSASLAFVWGIHRWPPNSHTKDQ